jgi:para-nitrobenzyl esterase
VATRAPVLETDAGAVRGAREGALAVLRGVPFAAPPRGALRFRPPVQPEAWAGVRDATRFGPAAPQLAEPLSQRLGLAPRAPVGEDCLNLNVFTPALDGARRPVLVWIHGGAFSTGSGSAAAYDGARLAARGDAVVVTLDYRVGALGFLHAAALPGFAPDCADLGLQDQLAALRWVRAHADRIGGDPARVTVIGESAGAGSICALLAMPAARGLFAGAIALSPAAEGMLDAADAARRAERFLELAGLAPGEAALLAELPLEALLEAQRRFAAAGPWKLDMPFAPVLDGRTLPCLPVEAAAVGAARDVPLVIGTTADEMRLFSLSFDPAAIGEPILRAQLARVLRGAAPDGTPDAERVAEGLRALRAARREPAAPGDVLLAAQAELRLRFPAIRLAEAHARHGRAYMHLFTWRSPLEGGRLGACHALDIPFALGTLDAPGMRDFAGAGPDAERLAGRCMDAWLAFARSGDPSHPGIGPWPCYDTGRRATMELGARCGVLDAPLEAERRLLESVDWKTVA